MRSTCCPGGRASTATAAYCPGRPRAQLEAELADALGTDVPYELELIDPLVGGTISSIDSPLFEACADFLRARDPDAIVLPTICAGFTDSHYTRATFGSVAYGFWPARATPLDVWARTVHGDDERIHVDDLGYATSFHLDACRALLCADNR